ncbi:asparagine synthase [Lineolata rhizophorae]|uniref:Asparagine synthase n=1 Tax=Lineolata rhizophorae TaxID=578093 RepID=A0A6A6P5G6_9PEZI|nr:asparagine synthase [Lineolata rhizophorae]
MCGIYAAISKHRYAHPTDAVRELLDKRGPDTQTQHVDIESTSAAGTVHYLSFQASVLALRGDHVARQPLRHPETGSVLCWNGEAWAASNVPLRGNDSEHILKLFSDACSAPFDEGQGQFNQRILQAIASIRGPYAFAYYDVPNGKLYYSRDCLGRRSLLINRSDDTGDLILSSVANGSDATSWLEVEAAGVYMVDLSEASNQYIVHYAPYSYEADRVREVTETAEGLVLPYPKLNKNLPSHSSFKLNLTSPHVASLESHLRESIVLRLQPSSLGDLQTGNVASPKPRIAILFSGGLDCSLLARLAHDIVPIAESIDLLNVAFENPRIQRSAPCSSAPYETCPDRITARTSLAELQRMCPERQWRLVEIDVPYAETLAHRPIVIGLIHPHNTEMDLSISLALYFAARGVGTITTATDAASSTRNPYATPARVLLSGLGADELFGGYQRHALAFAHGGFAALADELDLDISRLGKRNLGRDDRVLSHWGKEVRYPYLDEGVVGWAMRARVWEKCGFGAETSGEDGDLSLGPEKKVLRLVAKRCGLQIVAAERKRAIQFGARTAKMETGRMKGTQILS